MCSVRGQSHRLSLSLHYLRRLQGNTVFIAAHSVEGRGGGGSRRLWACGCLLSRGSSGGQSRRISTQPTLVSTRGTASSTKWPETSARNVASRSALRWGWQPTVSRDSSVLLVCVSVPGWENSNSSYSAIYIRLTDLLAPRPPKTCCMLLFFPKSVPPSPALLCCDWLVIIIIIT